MKQHDMALGKCVIISSGPAVDDVVPTDAAITVPPEDIATLTSAIKTTLNDPNLREQTATAGKTYAYRWVEKKIFTLTF